MNTKPISEYGAIILGGTAGVGLETAAQFAEQGARIVLLGRNPQRGAVACDVVRGRSPNADVEFIQVDATDPGDLVRAERAARARLGAVDVLVCTTGPSRPPALLHNIAVEDFKPRLEEIILPPLYMMHAVLPTMRAQKSGSIINVASDAAKVATPGETLIGAAMAAIIMFSRAAALEVKREGVRINILTPSLIAGTPGAALIAADPFASRMFAKAADMAHLGVADAQDLAAMAVYLAGPAARRITGQAISINGGISVA
ncbi:SDR family oxidoreductase [Paraburkholderia sp. USG1]|uniref:SDR family NAD(P)-dependent oxidoreductase n=1 Tax=Paraburkholderia sp. USG1 TaxID=2952268 RepID=UPI00285D580D|nr:SDR family oxidoreductase [Paraburkholderia sp. USG1]MDR8398386.1 SDR family oxidoreductase [Paraburkholderia sp. USG1]